MTPREQLIQEVLQAPDFWVKVLLKLLHLVRSGQDGVAQQLAKLAEISEEKELTEDSSAEGWQTPVLFHEGSALVVGGSLPDGFDTNQFITELREERIHEQMGL